MTKIIPSPAVLARMKLLYETSQLSVVAIARLGGMSANTLHRRIEEYGWTARRLQRRDANRTAAEIDQHINTEIDAQIARLESEPAARLDMPTLISSVRSEVETLLASFSRAGLARASDVESRARALMSLTRALALLQRMDQQTQGVADDTEKDWPAEEDGPKNLDELRDELQRRVGRSLGGVLPD